jgi:uncharacterized protein
MNPWQRIGRFVLQYRLPLMIALLAFTGVMGYFASKVKISYDFSRAIPTDNKKYIEYQAFKKLFGEDGNLMVVAVQTDSLFQLSKFTAYSRLHRNLKAVTGVDDVLSIPSAITLVKDMETEKLNARRVFADTLQTQADLDSAAALFRTLPFYQGLLYNPDTKTYLVAVRVSGAILNSPERVAVMANIEQAIAGFQQETGFAVYKSGLPLIRNTIANRVSNEMKWFLLGSLILSALILLAFFRSPGNVLLSLAVVIIGVIWSFGIMYLFGYKITLLNALIPPLVVVIGIPNCIYFLNKYHSAFKETGDKELALQTMLSRMGVVTLFCNLTAAIGFAVFALTKSQLLKEFGYVAGISIMAIFFISYILIPGLLSYMKAPTKGHLRYLDNKWLVAILESKEKWAVEHPRFVFGITGLILAISVVGILRLKTEAKMVDDLPKTDRIYTDLKFIEKNFKGVMPLEIEVDTRKKYGVTRIFQNLEKMDSLVQYLTAQPDMARPLSVIEGMKFVRQAYYDGDSAAYMMPTATDLPFLSPYLNTRGGDSTGKGNNLSKLLGSFMDSSKQIARISVNMADVGNQRLPIILDSCRKRANELFDTAKYTVHFTGTSVTFLEGSRYIINGLKDSILYAFILITLCMLFLFRSFRIVICSLLPNIVPLIITAGIMGWAGIPIKPSTILVFSVVLGIAIDITIRFLVNYRQELPLYGYDIKTTVQQTIRHTGLSIIYTSFVLIAGFVIFCFSSFGGTQALGWLTSLTLVVATLTNLILLPLLLLATGKKKQ